MKKLLRRLWPFARIEDQLEEILRNQRAITQQENKNAMTLADIDTALAATDTNVAALQAETAQLIALKSTQPDTTAEVTHLNNINTALSALLAAEQQEVTPVPPPVTGTPAPAAS
jgi:phosphoglycerate-specific signal transduction histidine kinase